MTKIGLKMIFPSPTEAITYALTTPGMGNAQLAAIVAFLFANGLTNREIRASLNIKKVYTVTHLKRAGAALTPEEMELWHSNPARITLGHIRAIAKLPLTSREPLLRSLLLKKQPVSDFEALAKGKHVENSADIRKFERVIGDILGRDIKVDYNSKNSFGYLQLSFYGLDDLENITTALQEASRPKARR
jgi:ParB family transcriptional regulator, chromosome partitioning protein